MRNFEDLKQLLIRVKNNDYSVPDGVDLDSIIDDMLKFIGHTDAELRDELIYTTFVQWCEIKEVVSAEQMKYILNICLDEQHLFFGIGEKDTDSVFTRSFSSLLINVAFCVHHENPFLAAKDIHGIKEAVLRYISQEKDYRGYVAGKGWAHAIAHIADALLTIADVNKAIDVDGNYNIGREGLMEVLQAVKSLVCNKEYVYTAEEDERLVIPFMVATDHKILTSKELIGWINSFNAGDKEYRKGTMPNDYYLYINRKNFMRSLYFKLQSQIETEGFEEICKFMLGFLVDADD